MSQLPLDGIGRRIARYRKMNGWSARQLAHNTDGALSRDTIANIETGRRTELTLRQFLSIALALRIPPFALLIDLEHPFDASNIRFPGSASAPLAPTAPQIALAAWINGHGESATTPAGRWVTEVTTLLTAYLAASDATEVRDILQRLTATPPPLDSTDLDAEHRSARIALETLGVHVPDEP